MAENYDGGKLIYLLTQIEQTCEAVAGKRIGAKYGQERVKGYIAAAMAELQAETLAETAVRLEKDGQK